MESRKHDRKTFLTKWVYILRSVELLDLIKRRFIIGAYMYISRCVPIPYMHATATAAHVFPQQQAVESWGSDEVGELMEGLLHEPGGQSLIGKSRVQCSQLPQHCHHGGSIGSSHHDPGIRARPLPGHSRASQTRDGVALQQSRDWEDEREREEWRWEEQWWGGKSGVSVVLPMMVCRRFSVMVMSCW